MLVAGGNRFAAYHMQQAVEKIVKALLLAKGIEAGVEHRLEELLKRFAPEDEWLTRIAPLVSYSAFATAFRYPTPGGRIPADPPQATVRRDLALVNDLLALARAEWQRDGG
ncbi:MAG: HEPN domain-containing protein [Kofleriaceae bacterium]|nr:HEPN domain-containing protein [Kofleriaceae bacterium]